MATSSYSSQVFYSHIDNIYFTSVLLNDPDAPADPLELGHYAQLNYQLGTSFLPYNTTDYEVAISHVSVPTQNVPLFYWPVTAPKVGIMVRQYVGKDVNNEEKLAYDHSNVTTILYPQATNYVAHTNSLAITAQPVYCINQIIDSLNTAISAACLAAYTALNAQANWPAGVTTYPPVFGFDPDAGRIVLLTKNTLYEGFIPPTAVGSANQRFQLVIVLDRWWSTTLTGFDLKDESQRMTTVSSALAYTWTDLDANSRFSTNDYPRSFVLSRKYQSLIVANTATTPLALDSFTAAAVTLTQSDATAYRLTQQQMICPASLNKLSKIIIESPNSPFRVSYSTAQGTYTSTASQTAAAAVSLAELTVDTTATSNPSLGGKLLYWPSFPHFNDITSAQALSNFSIGLVAQYNDGGRYPIRIPPGTTVDIKLLFRLKPGHEAKGAGPIGVMTPPPPFSVRPGVGVERPVAPDDYVAGTFQQPDDHPTLHSVYEERYQLQDHRGPSAVRGYPVPPATIHSVYKQRHVKRPKT
jgi:hypothetical protein